MSKYGFAKGFQRYRCKQCGKVHNDIPESARPLLSLRVEPEKAYQVIHLLAEGMSVRGCERLIGLNRRTILNILETAGEKCKWLLDAKLMNLKVEQVQIDETYSFVHCLQQNTTVDNQLHGDQYAFFAIER